MRALRGGKSLSEAGFQVKETLRAKEGSRPQAEGDLRASSFAPPAGVLKPAGGRVSPISAGYSAGLAVKLPMIAL